MLLTFQDKAGSFEDTLVNLKERLSTDRDELKILKEDREDYQKVPPNVFQTLLLFYLVDTKDCLNK